MSRLVSCNRMSAASVKSGAIWWMLMRKRQAWCNLQVKLGDPCLSALSLWHTKMALYKHSSFFSFPGSHLQIDGAVLHYFAPFLTPAASIKALTVSRLWNSGETSSWCNHIWNKIHSDPTRWSTSVHGRWKNFFIACNHSQNQANCEWLSTGCVCDGCM